MAEPVCRLFFALWPDERMQAALAEAVGAIATSGGGRLVPTQNLHLTLVFLGALPESRIALLSPIAAQVAAAFSLGDEPLTVMLDRVQYWRKSQILCATASADPPAAVELSDALKRALIEQGFAPDLKPFRAHATVARKVQRVTRELEMPAVRWSFRDFHLVESRKEPNGSIYSSREKWPLDK